MKKHSLTKHQIKLRRIVTLTAIASVLTVILISFIVLKYSPSSYTPSWNADDEFNINNTLTYNWQNLRDDGNLRVLVLGDPQLKIGTLSRLDRKTLKLIECAIDEQKPDMAVVVGDLTASAFAHDAIKSFADLMERKKLYWAFTYGNHDDQISISKFRTYVLLQNYKYCLFDAGPSNIKGESNYFVNVMSKNKLVYSLCMLDSNTYSKSGNSKYDSIAYNQIEWYNWYIEKLQEIKYDVESMMFFHIPLPQYTEYNPITSIQGVDNGLLANIVYHNSTKAIFVGHDHLGKGYFTKDGVTLAYANNCGYFTYPYFSKPNWFTDLIGISNYPELFESATTYPDGQIFSRAITVVDVNLTDNYGNISINTRYAADYAVSK